MKDHSQLMDNIAFLELMLKKLGDDNSNEIDSIIKAENAFTNPQKCSHKKGYQSKKKRDVDDHVSLDLILQAMKLQSMNEHQFQAFVSSECQKMMNQLMNHGQEKVNKTWNQGKVELDTSSQPLNERQKILNVPWKGERRFLDE